MIGGKKGNKISLNYGSRFFNNLSTLHQIRNCVFLTHKVLNDFRKVHLKFFGPDLMILDSHRFFKVSNMRRISVVLVVNHKRYVDAGKNKFKVLGIANFFL